MANITGRKNMIDKIFERKKELLQDMAEKNVTEFNELEKQLTGVVEGLQANTMECVQVMKLQNDIKMLERQEKQLTKKLQKLHSLLDIVNTVNQNQEVDKPKNMSVEDILSAASKNKKSYKKLKKQFIKIGQLSKDIEGKVIKFHGE